MPSLDFIMQVLNGSHGAAIFAALRYGFLGCMVACVVALLVVSRPGRKQLWLLVAGLWFAVVAVLAYQGAWQLAGFRRPEFVRFLRVHDARPDALHKQVQRGTIYDWRGTVLAETHSEDPTRRLYPYGPAASHVVGYLHPRYGASGMERAADAALSGYSFENLAELDRFGRNLFDRRGAVGGDVRLTLDAELQRKAYALLTGEKGAVVVVRPSDGAILCLVSAPGFDPRDPGSALQNAADSPLLNRAVQGLYPPGSTFKIVGAGMALERHLTPQYRCPSEGFQPEKGGRPIRDSEYYIGLREGRGWSGHGRIDLRYGFIHSSNVYFAQLGLALGGPAYQQTITACHISERIVYYDGLVGSLASQAGQVPSLPAGNRRVLAQLAIGQGKLLVTPLHVAMWTAAVAAQGELWRPRLRADAPPERLGRVWSAATATELREMMREAVRSGTGRPANLPGLQVCGKTGTAEAPGGSDHAWFTCFAPRLHPELVVTVLVENGGYGSQAAAPIARALLQEAVDLGLLGEGTQGGAPVADGGRQGQGSGLRAQVSGFRVQGSGIRPEP